MINSLLKIITITLILTYIPFKVLNAQCSINNATVSSQGCQENNFFSAVIDFDVENPGSGFTIMGNGQNYGTFSYDELPVSISGLIGDCQFEYSFIVRDIDDPLCSILLDLGSVCCECFVDITDVEVSDCQLNIGGYSIFLDANPMIDSVVIMNNDTLYGTVSTEDFPFFIANPWGIGNFKSDLKICASNDSTCCDQMTIYNPCTCNLSNPVFSFANCDADDETFFITLDFEYSDMASDSFSLGYFGNFLGSYAYQDLPVTVGPIDFGENIELLVLDSSDPFCFMEAGIGTIQDCDFQCAIYNTFAEAMPCDGDTYEMVVSFETADLTGSQFEIIVDDISYGIFDYGDTQYTISGVTTGCDAPPVVIVRDLVDTLCMDFFNFPDTICCEIDCHIIAVNISALECQGDSFMIALSLAGTGITDYVAEINGKPFGPFTGDMTNIEVGPFAGDCQTIYTATLTANGDTSCTLQASLNMPVCCESQGCQLSITDVINHGCTEDSISLEVLIDFSNIDFDSIYITTNSGIFLGSFEIGDSTYLLPKFIPDCSDIIGILVSGEGCSDTFDFDMPLCCCPISDLMTTITDCNEEEYALSIDISIFPLLDSVIIEYEQYTSTFGIDDFPVIIEGLSIGTEHIISVYPPDSSCEVQFTSILEKCETSLKESNYDKVQILTYGHTIAIKNPSLTPYSWSVFDLSGKVLFKKDCPDGRSTNFDLQNLSGIFFISVETKNTIATKKLFIAD